MMMMGMIYHGNLVLFYFSFLAFSVTILTLNTLLVWEDTQLQCDCGLPAPALFVNPDKNPVSVLQTTISPQTGLATSE